MDKYRVKRIISYSKGCSLLSLGDFVPGVGFSTLCDAEGDKLINVAQDNFSVTGGDYEVIFVQRRLVV
jgi:hypothetical protein